jgi:ankyrin repeat protein
MLAGSICGYSFAQRRQQPISSVATTLAPRTPESSGWMLISYGENVAPPFPGTLDAAAADGDVASMTALHRKSEGLNFASGGLEWTPLHWAAWKNQSLTTKKLLELGADPRSGDQNGMSPMHIAAMYGNVSVLRELIRHRNAIELKNRWGYTPLQTAAASYATGAMTVLLDAGADPNAKEVTGATALHHAAYSVPTLELLLSRGADINMRDNQGETVLGKANRLKFAESVQLLRRNGGSE